jgi:plasmid stabilization system protein ParE
VPDLGERFAAALDVVFDHLTEQPRAFPVVHRDIRRAPVGSAFAAYQIFYRLEDELILVLAVIHTSRHPRAWRSRR